MHPDSVHVPSLDLDILVVHCNGYGTVPLVHDSPVVVQAVTTLLVNVEKEPKLIVGEVLIVV